MRNKTIDVSIKKDGEDGAQQAQLHPRVSHTSITIIIVTIIVVVNVLLCVSLSPPSLAHSLSPRSSSLFLSLSNWSRWMAAWK